MKGARYRPLKFLDQMKGKKHVIMLYDDEKRADFLIARYFANGFERGESCVFYTDGDPTPFRKRLASQGIDVDRYEKEKRLRLSKIPTPDQKGDALKMLKAGTAELTRGMKGPFRFVNEKMADIESVSRMKQEMKVEKVGNDHFKELDIALVCLLDVRKMEQSRRHEWIKGLLENHQSVIFASDPGKAVAFETSLLEEG